MHRQHDADLCERLRKLEERVRELEARPPVIAYPPIIYPTWPSPWTIPHPWQPVWISSGTTWTADSTFTGDSTTVTTYGLTTGEQ